MTGKILKGVGGFYYVYADDSKIYECRARGIFRNKKMKVRLRLMNGKEDQCLVDISS